jgi:hypothetical protein
VAGRPSTFTGVVCRADRRRDRARTSAPDRRSADYRPDRGFNSAAGRQESAVSTGSPVLGRLLAGPGFLDAAAFPEIRSRSGQLVWVPAIWRAVGGLRVKDTEHQLPCQLDLHLGDTRPGGPPRIIIASSWVIDSRWVTSQWIRGVSRRIVMTFYLEPDM